MRQWEISKNPHLASTESPHYPCPY